MEQCLWPYTETQVPRLLFVFRLAPRTTAPLS